MQLSAKPENKGNQSQRKRIDITPFCVQYRSEGVPQYGQGQILIW